MRASAAPVQLKARMQFLQLSFLLNLLKIAVRHPSKAHKDIFM